MSVSTATADSKAPTTFPAKTSFAANGPSPVSPRCPTTAAIGSDTQNAYDDAMRLAAIAHLTCALTMNCERSAATASIRIPAMGRLACATRHD